VGDSQGNFAAMVGAINEWGGISLGLCLEFWFDRLLFYAGTKEMKDL
jgi:hypothetical protein